jgi:hypothetical protein
MISPFLFYAVSFVGVMLIYLLGWSELYPKLSSPLIVFLLISIVANVIAHLKLRAIPFKKLEKEKLPPIATTVFIYILWTVDFIYEGGIPLIKILFHLPYNYRLFGVPSLHVFIVTFSSFFTVYLFHLYVSKRTTLLLILYLINLAAALLIYSRAMLFFNITGSIIVYLMSLRKLPYVKMALIVASLIPLLFLFGVLGSLRVSREAHEQYNNENFMNTGKASEAFRQSIIPKEFFWTYVYVSSSLANLQLNINDHEKSVVSFTSLFWTGVYECLPDFITKRIHTLRDTNPPKEYRIGHSFNVSTVYSRAYCYSNWTGMILMGVFMLTVPVIFLKLIDSDSDFFVTGWAILCTMYLFTSYDNTFRFTGLSLQLAYPVLFYFAEKWFKTFVNKTVT